MVRDPQGRLRRPRARELELLHGYSLDYTLAAVKSSQAKADPQAEQDLRSSLIGNGFNCFVVAWLVSHLAAQLGYLQRPPTPAEVKQGEVHKLAMRLAPDVCDERPRSVEWGPEERLTRWYLARAGQRGSDVRLVSNELASPDRVQFAAIDPRLWRWRTQLSLRWQHKGTMIAELELQALLLEVRHRLRSTRNFHAAWLVIIDNMVTLSLLAKRRSSSRVLNRILTKLNMLCLASNARPCGAYVRSAANPADRPSRTAPPRPATGRAGVGVRRKAK